MKAIVINEFGGPEVFVEAEVPKPELRDGHLLVRVKASSVNPVDYKVRAGLIPPITPKFPAVLGCDVAGVVDEVGAGVTDFSVGDEVYFCAGSPDGIGGALAEFCLVDAAQVAKKPQLLGFEEAAALPLVMITAWDGLIDRADVGPGMKVLVHGATGGVGHAAVQLVKGTGAEVFATASSEEKLAIGKALGADVGINYREKSVEDYVEEHTGGAGFDVVFDTVGGDNVLRSMTATGLNGQVVSISTRCECDLSQMHMRGLSMHVVFMLIPMFHDQPAGKAHHGEILREVARRVDAGELKPLVHDERFDFAEVGKAHTLLESGAAVGKVVLRGW
ncbi:MAG: NADPH2:quinone reductase [Verrucomicrobiales bacterium]|jgi:NADPH2:quinone reductase